MRDFWAFIVGVAVGVLAVTGVKALEEDERPSIIEDNEDKADEQEMDDEKLIVRSS